jgi:hypothetical protein
LVDALHLSAIQGGRFLRDLVQGTATHAGFQGVREILGERRRHIMAGHHLTLRGLLTLLQHLLAVLSLLLQAKLARKNVGAEQRGSNGLETRGLCLCHMRFLSLYFAFKLKAYHIFP